MTGPVRLMLCQLNGAGEETWEWITEDKPSMGQDHYGKNLVGFDQWPEVLTVPSSQDQGGSTAAPEILLKCKFSGLTSDLLNQNLWAGGLGICLSKSSRA